MNNYRQPLPAIWVNKIFATMQGHYGSRFVNMWKTGDTLPNGQDAGYSNAQRYWADKLAGFEDHPECIAHALESLPETPPTLPQFLDMCRRAPRKEPLKLGHTLTPEEINRNKERLDGLLKGLCGKMVTGDKQ